MELVSQRDSVAIQLRTRKYMKIHLRRQDIVDLVRLTGNPYIHVVEEAGVYYIACEKPEIDYSCQEAYEVILTWIIQVNTESIDFRYNPKWFGYAPEKTVRKLYEDLIKMNRLMGEVKQRGMIKVKE